MIDGSRWRQRWSCWDVIAPWASYLLSLFSMTFTSKNSEGNMAWTWRLCVRLGSAVLIEFCGHKCSLSILWLMIRCLGVFNSQRWHTPQTIDFEAWEGSVGKIGPGIHGVFFYFSKDFSKESERGKKNTALPTNGFFSCEGNERAFDIYILLKTENPTITRKDIQLNNFQGRR